MSASGPSGPLVVPPFVGTLYQLMWLKLLQTGAVKFANLSCLVWPCKYPQTMLSGTFCACILRPGSLLRIEG